MASTACTTMVRGTTWAGRRDEIATDGGFAGGVVVEGIEAGTHQPCMLRKRRNFASSSTMATKPAT